MTRAQYNGPSPYDGQEIVVPDGVIAMVFIRPDGDSYFAEYAEVRSHTVDRSLSADALAQVSLELFDRSRS